MIAPTGEASCEVMSRDPYNLYSKGYRNALISGNFIRKFDSYLFSIRSYYLSWLYKFINDYIQVAIRLAVDEPYLSHIRDRLHVKFLAVGKA